MKKILKSDLTIASLSFSSWWANTLEVSNIVDAGSTVTAWIRSAVVDVYSTIWSSKTECTFTKEPVDTIDALAAIVARLRRAIIDVILAVISFEAIPADALVIVACIDAGSTVETRIGTTCCLGSYVTCGS